MVGEDCYFQRKTQPIAMVKDLRHKDMRFWGSARPGFGPWLCHLLSEAGKSISLHLSCLPCEMEIKASTSQYCFEDSMR